ncbi:hypothetical protein [Cytophaga hutchinsonii]|uniref:DUF4595 domain-containing protein n=1 Tax=Cytophaga hutchinsonii (strain ATCC 33406 / DSM 1761 / CIP 103989 / NBRC 15051 / NCIMB 9469 / D465) TaxID=269798 RepID=A0A6N4ST09_CYTH3|nr:hypothetical protein [Cytophaga hutchinsonii]ABG59497.1 hypothetical protein CHU_2234 [Cytophaga hutchinsonii ATCC 33406]SFX94182.1 hypothetical protein SAMN04487930_11410 [Cytophaga hutchinsonii ATCC 33406]
MKTKLFYICLLPVLCFACKKNIHEIPNPEGNLSSADTKEYLRTSVFTEDDPDAFYLYEYDDKKRLTQLTQYDNGSIIYSFAVTYNADTIKKSHAIADINNTAITNTVFYIPDSEGKIIRALINADTVYYTYTFDGYLHNRITKNDSTTFEYVDGNMTQSTKFSRLTKNQLGYTNYTYTSYPDKSSIMDPMHTGLLQEVFGKKSKNLIASETTGSRTVTFVYTLDLNGLPVKILGLNEDGSNASIQQNIFQIR